MTLKFKLFYDSKIHVSFNLKDTGHFGVVFRFQDVGNFYYLDITVDKLKFCRYVLGKHKCMED